MTYNGVQYEGKQPLIIDPGTWEKVQGVLKSHVNGERSVSMSIISRARFIAAIAAPA